MNSLEALQANFKMYLGQLRCCYCHCTACSGCDGCVASTSETSEAPKATPLLESRRNRIARFGSSTFPKADCSKSRRPPHFLLFAYHNAKFVQRKVHSATLTTLFSVGATCPVLKKNPEYGRQCD